MTGDNRGLWVSKAYQEGITIPEFAVTAIEGLRVEMSLHGESRLKWTETILTNGEAPI